MLNTQNGATVTVGEISVAVFSGDPMSNTKPK
jgi:hypothetical protein